MGIEDRLHANDELGRMLGDLGFVTGSATLMPLLRHVYKAACVSDITLLLEGEAGAGKQALAYAIHCLDRKRRAFPFITVQCGALDEALAESDFFGCVKGASVGAVTRRKGYLQSAQGGTLFLDDVNELLPPAQVKLLDVLQRGVVRTAGSDLEIQVDVRIIAASNVPLEPLVLQNHFRADLYRWLKVVRLLLPPLRDRMQDLSSLALAFAHRHPDICHRIEKLEPEFVSFLKSNSFPGGGRKLENGNRSSIS